MDVRLGEDPPIVFEVVDEGGWAVVTVPSAPLAAAGWALIFRALAGAGISPDMMSGAPARAAGGRHDLSFLVRRNEVEAAVEALRGAVRDLGCEPVRSDADVRRVSIIGRGFRSAEGYAASCFEVCAAVGVRFGIVSVSDTRMTVVCDPGSTGTLRAAFAPDISALAI